MKKAVREKRLLVVALWFLLTCTGAQSSARSRTTATAPVEVVAVVTQALPSPTPLPPPQEEKKKAPPPARYIQVGKSVRGNSITATIFGEGKRRVLLVAGVHGNEQDTSIVAKAFIGSLGQESGPPELTIMVIPDLNPDGLFSNTRVNARGVDINRNFPSLSWRNDYPDAVRFPGFEPASEPETRAFINMMWRYPPDFIITLHAAMGCVNWDGPAEALARVIAPINGYPLCPYLGYETPGSLGAYMGVDRKVPVVTIELRKTRASELVKENLPALRAVLLHIAAIKETNR